MSPKPRVYSDLFVVAITITGRKITKDANLFSYPRGPVVWVVVNNDLQDYRVEIDYQKIKHKSNGSKTEHPLKGSGKNTIDVPAAPAAGKHTLSSGVDLINDFTPSYNPDLYDYTVELFEKGSHVSIDAVDPDLEVVDPFPFIHAGRTLRKAPARKQVTRRPKRQATRKRR